MKQIPNIHNDKTSGQDPALTLVKNQNGSVIVLVLMVMLIMTVIGIVSSETVVTENFIVRNVGIRNQNVSMLDSAIMLGLQRFMQIPDNNPDNFTTNGPFGAWINDEDNAAEYSDAIWYQNNFTQRQLTAANSTTIATAFPPNTTFPLLTTRGEADGNLRFAVVGFEPMGGTSIVTGTGSGNWRQGRILAEYVSVDGGGNDRGNGLMRMEIGVRRKW